MNPQPIVLGLIQHEYNVLLVKRSSGDFIGLWGRRHL